MVRMPPGRLAGRLDVPQEGGSVVPQDRLEGPCLPADLGWGHHSIRLKSWMKSGLLLRPDCGWAVEDGWHSAKTLMKRADETENVWKGVFGVKEVMVSERLTSCGRAPEGLDPVVGERTGGVWMWRASDRHRGASLF